MTRWNIKPGPLDEREHDYTAHFVATNLETDKCVTIALTQNKVDHPASDLIGALRAVAILLSKSSKAEPDDSGVASLQ
jgi:hypothetical protein